MWALNWYRTGTGTTIVKEIVYSGNELEVMVNEISQPTISISEAPELSVLITDISQPIVSPDIENVPSIIIEELESLIVKINECP